jgi:tetratricopeptide (TPR) repeat protein
MFNHKIAISSIVLQCIAFFMCIQLCSAQVIQSAQAIQDDFEPKKIDLRFSTAPDAEFLALKKRHLAAVNSGDLTTQGICLKDMGMICFHLGDYTRALQYGLDAIKLFKQLKRNDFLADTYVNLGTLYYYNTDPVKSRSSFNQALKIYRSVKDQLGIAVTMGKIGHLMEKKQLYDSAFFYQQKALEAYTTINNDKGIAEIYGNMGSIHEDLGHYDKAMPYFLSALSIYKASNQVIQSIEAENNIGDIYRKTGNLKKAMEQTQQVLKLARQTNEIYQISSAYRDISKIYNLMGKNDSAFYYSEVGRSYLMKIYSLETSRQMAFRQALNDEEKKNEEIKFLQNERKVTLIVTVATIVIILLLVVAGLLMLSRHRIKLKSEQQASQQNIAILEAEKQLMEAGLKNKNMEEIQLKQEIELKSKELSTHVLHVIQKNQVLEGLKVQLEELVKDDKRDQKKQLKQMITLINQDFNNDSYWNDFSNVFEQIHKSFFEKLNQQFPNLTSTDLKLVSLLKMNMNSTDMASMLAISQDSLRIARYRLRKKLNLDQGDNLIAFLQSI